MAIATQEMTRTMGARKLNLVDLRIEAGFERQEDLANAAGLVRSTIWLAENSSDPDKDIRINRKTAAKIVKALKSGGLIESNGILVTVDNIDWKIR